MEKKEKKADYKERFEKKMQMIEEMWELINLFWLLIYDTKDMTDSERVEKIWNAINIFYDKYED